MSRYKPYPKYKESGVEWLGEVPYNWQIVRNKQVFRFEKKLVGSDSSNYLLLSLTLDGIKPRNIEGGKGKFPAEFDTYQVVKKNDIVFCLFDIDETPRTVGLSNIDGMITGAYNVARCNSLGEPRFIYYYYLSIDEYKGLKPFYTGLRKVVRPDTFMNIKLALPSLSEQTAIANFLDRETAKIDTLIGKQERLIELLQEKRQALISHAVTKGLDPNVKMKESGVEWLGEVPEHWKIPKIKYFAVTDSGATPASTNRQEYYENGIYPWIRTTDLNNGELFSTPIKITQKAIKDTACNIVPEGSVLIGMYGGAGTIGKHSLLRFPSTINQAVCSITPNKEIVPEFLHYTIQFYRPYWMIGAMGTRKDPNIGQDTINNRHLPIPPIEEQHQIVAYLDTQTTKIDILVEKANQAIKLLKERRTALISAAVTGKIQVNDEGRENTLGCDVREKTT